MRIGPIEIRFVRRKNPEEPKVKPVVYPLELNRLFGGLVKIMSYSEGTFRAEVTKYGKARLDSQETIADMLNICYMFIDMHSISVKLNINERPVSDCYDAVAFKAFIRAWTYRLREMIEEPKESRKDPNQLDLFDDQMPQM